MLETRDFEQRLGARSPMLRRNAVRKDSIKSSDAKSGGSGGPHDIGRKQGGRGGRREVEEMLDTHDSKGLVARAPMPFPRRRGGQHGGSHGGGSGGGTKGGFNDLDQFLHIFLYLRVEWRPSIPQRGIVNWSLLL